MKSHFASLAVDEFATRRAGVLILIGRILLAWVFVGSAYGALFNFSGSVGYFRSLNLPAPELFTIVNLARFLGVDPEQALRRTNGRFRRRFVRVEKEITARNGASLERMEELWQEAKHLEEREAD